MLKATTMFSEPKKADSAPKPVKTKQDAGKSKDKALRAKKAATKGAHDSRRRKIRTTVHFRRPKTLRLARDPKYPRKSTPRRNR